MNAGEEFFNLLDELKCEIAYLREEVQKLREFMAGVEIVLEEKTNEKEGN